MRKLIVTISFAALFVFLGCSNRGQQQQDLSSRTIKAVATTGMIGDAVTSIGGDRVEVTVLMGPGVDPHLYRASEGDVTRMSDADVIFYNGLHLEGRMGEVLEHIGRYKTVVAIGEALPDDRRLHAGDHPDPHIWFDLNIWSVAVSQIESTFRELDPTHDSLYAAQGQAYITLIEETNQYIIERTSSLPENKRVLITAHDAFSYFGRAYGYEVRGLQGISTASEAGTADVQGLSTFIAQRQIPAIFVETSVPVRTIKAVQAAVQSRNYNVQIGGELFSDAMGSPDTPEGNYIGMVRHNIDTIVNALSE